MYDVSSAYTDWHQDKFRQHTKEYSFPKTVQPQES